MLALYFHIGRESYALDTSRIQEIVPIARTKQLHGCPAFVEGLLNYHGIPVPVIDLPRLMTDKPYRRVFGTRILIVRYRSARDAHQHLLGLIVEEVSRTVRMDAGKLTSSGVKNDSTPYLKEVAATSDGIIQVVEPNELLPEEVQEMLFQKN